MPRKDNDMVRVSLHIPRRNYDRLTLLSKNAHLPLSEIIRRSVEVFFRVLDSKREKPNPQAE